MLSFALLDPCKFIEVANLACDLDSDVAGIKLRDAPNATFARQDSARELFVAGAIRTDRPHAGNDDASIHASLGHHERFKEKGDAYLLSGDANGCTSLRLWRRDHKPFP